MCSSLCKRTYNPYWFWYLKSFGRFCGCGFEPSSSNLNHVVWFWHDILWAWFKTKSNSMYKLHTLQDQRLYRYVNHLCIKLTGEHWISNGSILHTVQKYWLLLFRWLINCPTKLCMVMIRHILVLPIHKFCVLLCMLWACNGDQKPSYNKMPPSVHYTLKVCIKGPKFFVLASFIFFFQKDRLGQGHTRKEWSKQYFCTVSNKDPLLI